MNYVNTLLKGKEMKGNAMEVMGMGGAVFSDVSQAVHVAYVVMAQGASHGAPLRKALLRVMEEVHLDSEQQRHWLDQLRGERSSTVNFEGLSQLDIRAQCSMVAQVVRTKLPDAEKWVLQAKYGHTDFEDEEGVRRFAFSAERIAAIHGLSQWLAPLLPKIPVLALDCMLGRMFAKHCRIKISARTLAANFGGNHTQYLRAAKIIKEHVLCIEKQAIARLTPYFAGRGLIPRERSSTLVSSKIS